MILESLIGGGLFGFLGSFVNKGFAIFERSQKIEERKLAFEHEIRLQEMQMKAKQSETENELLIAEQEASAEAFLASYAHDSSIGNTSRWVNNTLRLVRPLLTVMLILLVGLIWFTIDDGDMRHNIITSVIAMASTALTWWFGDRGVSSKR